ncbi:MAG: hypothetical protein KDI82_03495 [Gammaproteobacteria bacterium]|nr:hypothetical protein [Gammaproteobacteria bacterium]
MKGRMFGARGAVSRWWVVLGLALACSHALALTVSVDTDPMAPGIQSTLDALAGDSLTVDVVISDVNPLFPLIGFDISLGFDPAVLGLTGISSGGFLPIPAVPMLPSPSPGVARFAEASLGFTPPFASGNGVLFKLSFDALADGATAISFTDVGLTGGLLGIAPFPVPTPMTDFGIENATVNVGPGVVEMPLPSVTFLLLGGLLGRVLLSARRGAA